MDQGSLMRNFICRVSYLFKTACINAMLLEDRSISRIVNHAQTLEGDKLREIAKDNKKDNTWDYEYFQKISRVKISHSFSRGLQHQNPHNLVLYPLGLDKIKRYDI